MPRKTKIGTEVAHITCDLDTTFRVKGQSHQAALLTAVLARQAAAVVGVRTCWPWETAATLPSAWRWKVLRRPRGRRGAGSLLFYCFYRALLVVTVLWIWLCVVLMQLFGLMIEGRRQVVHRRVPKVKYEQVSTSADDVLPAPVHSDSFKAFIY